MKTFFSKGWRSLLVLLLLFIAWELIVKIMDIPEWLLPAPSKIFTEAFISWSDFTVHLLSTVNLSVHRLYYWDLYWALNSCTFIFNSIFKRILISFTDSVAKYSNDRLGTIVGYLVWFWHATQRSLSSLLFAFFL